MGKCSVTHGLLACDEQEIVINDKLKQRIYMKNQQNNITVCLQ